MRLVGGAGHVTVPPPKATQYRYLALKPTILFTEIYTHTTDSATTHSASPGGVCARARSLPPQLGDEPR